MSSMSSENTSLPGLECLDNLGSTDSGMDLTPSDNIVSAGTSSAGSTSGSSFSSGSSESGSVSMYDLVAAQEQQVQGNSEAVARNRRNILRLARGNLVLNQRLDRMERGMIKG